MKIDYMEPNAEIILFDSTIVTSMDPDIQGELGPDTNEKDTGDVGSWND